MRQSRLAIGLAALSFASLVAMVAGYPADAGQESGLPAAPKAVPIPAGRQVFYDLEAMPWNGGRKTILGETATFSLAQLNPKGPGGRPAASGHYHDYEQVMFGWQGVYEQTVGLNDSCRISKLTACLEPPNVQHTVGGYPELGQILTIEFVTVARRDLVPPRPTVDYPKSPEPRALPKGIQFFADFNKMPWIGEPGQARFKALIGEKSSLVLWSLPAKGFKGTTAAGHHHTVEQISYVLEGHARMRVGDQTRDAGPGTLVMIPADVEHLPMAPINNEDILLLDFQPIVRHDLLKRMGKS